MVHCTPSGASQRHAHLHGSPADDDDTISEAPLTMSSVLTRATACVFAMADTTRHASRSCACPLNRFVFTVWIFENCEQPCRSRACAFFSSSFEVTDYICTAGVVSDWSAGEPCGNWCLCLGVASSRCGVRGYHPRKYFEIVCAKSCNLVHLWPGNGSQCRPYASLNALTVEMPFPWVRTVFRQLFNNGNRVPTNSPRNAQCDK